MTDTPKIPETNTAKLRQLDKHRKDDRDAHIERANWINKLWAENTQLRQAIYDLGESVNELYPDDLQKWAISVLEKESV